MLDMMRKNANSGIMIVLFGVIIFVFALNFGPWAGRSMSEVPFAAQVNNDIISLANLNRAYLNQIYNMKRFRPDYNESQAERDGLKPMILDHLVRNELLYQAGKEHHLSVAARVLADEIRARVFQPNEPFSKDEYKKRVEGYLQMSLAQFEEQVGKDLVSQHVSELIASGIFLTDAEAQKHFVEQNSKVSIEFIKVKPSFFKVDENIAEDKVSAYVKDNKEKIEKYYKEHLSDFNKAAQVRASHILIKTNGDDSVENKKTKREKIDAILARLKKNEDFEQIAKTESDDIATRIKGGDLGYFTQEAMVEAFSKVAFSLKPGEISEVVESPFGFHLIKVTDKKDAQNTSLSDAEPTIAKKMIVENEQKTKATHFAQKALDLLKNNTPIESIKLEGLVNKKIKEHESKMVYDEPMADVSLDFSQSSGYIPKLGVAPEVINAAFNLSLEHKTANNLVETKDAIYAIRLKDKKDADLTSFDKDKNVIKERFASQRKNHYLEQYVNFLKSKAKIKINEAINTPVRV